MRNTREEDLYSRAGMTIIEVMVAVVVLTTTTMFISQFLVSGDRIYGRSAHIERATRLARNEAELLKANAPIRSELEDSIYEVTVGERMYAVERKIIENESHDSLFQGFPVQEIEIRVKNDLYDEQAIVEFRFLQGMSKE